MYLTNKIAFGGPWVLTSRTSLRTFKCLHNLVLVFPRVREDKTEVDDLLVT